MILLNICKCSCIFYKAIDSISLIKYKKAKKIILLLSSYGTIYYSIHMDLFSGE